MDQVIWPTVRGMAEEGNVYTGFLYAGLMIDKAGNPKVIEFNCRFGDPETQPVMLRLQSSLVLLVEAAFAKALDKVEAQWDPRPSLGVVLAAGGYPRLRQGRAINGLDAAAKLEGKVFHAGTALKDGQVVTAGGACCAPPPWATASRPRSSRPTAWPEVSGKAASTARTSATGPLPASAVNTSSDAVAQGRCARPRLVGAPCGALPSPGAPRIVISGTSYEGISPCVGFGLPQP
jgi:hypothetical protein